MWRENHHLTGRSNAGGPLRKKASPKIMAGLRNRKRNIDQTAAPGRDHFLPGRAFSRREGMK